MRSRSATVVLLTLYTVVSASILAVLDASVEAESDAGWVGGLALLASINVAAGVSFGWRGLTLPPTLGVAAALGVEMLRGGALLLADAYGRGLFVAILLVYYLPFACGFAAAGALGASVVWRSRAARSPANGR